MEQKEATAEKVSDAVLKFSEAFADGNLSDFSAFVSLCGNKDLDDNAIDGLQKAQLCFRTDSGDIEFTEEGKKLQFDMGLQTKILNKRRIEGLEADSMMSEMLANLENL